MLLDKIMVANAIYNSNDKVEMLEAIDRLPDMTDAKCMDIPMNYAVTIRGSQISNTDCQTKVFVDRVGNVCISLFDHERCAGATLIIDDPSFIRKLGRFCEDSTTKEKDIVERREITVIDLLDTCIGQRFERKDMIPIHQAVLDFYSSRGKVKKLTGLQTTRFNAIISTLGYIQKSSYLDSVSGKRVYYIEKINDCEEAEHGKK